MNILIYKIKGDRGWYSSGSELNGDEAGSPIFTNRSKAEKRIRDEIKHNQQRLDDWGKQALLGCKKAWWVERLAKWKKAHVVAFKLVEIKE